MPADAFMAQGIYGQTVVVVPSERLVIARFGTTYDLRLAMVDISRRVADTIAALHGPHATSSSTVNLSGGPPLDVPAQGLGPSSDIWLTIRSCGKSHVKRPTTTSVPIPPITTDGTVPNHAAVIPDSNSPSSFDAPINNEFIALTRPRIESGVASCTKVDLT